MIEKITAAWQTLFSGQNLHWGLPPDVSTHGAGIDQLIHTLHWFMAVLFIGWGLYLVYCLFRFRDREGHQADVQPKNFKLPKYLEIGVVIFEAGLLIFFSYPIWAKFRSAFPDESQALVVKITAEQFAWNIHYPGRDGKFGPTDIKLVDDVNTVGLDREHPDAKDDIVTINDFTVPVGKPVLVHLASKDVIHSFFLPFARVKQDAIPGMTIPVWFETKATTNGEIACAQLCGVAHYRMMGKFNVVSSAEYEEFLKREEEALAAGG